MDNQKIAARTAVLLGEFENKTASADPLPDLLADLMHYCDQHNHADFERCLVSARHSFNREKDHG